MMNTSAFVFIFNSCKHFEYVNTDGPFTCLDLGLYSSGLTLHTNKLSLKWFNLYNVLE